MLHKETIVFAWETPEFERKEKRRDWYWIVGIAGVVLIVIAIILNNYLFAFLIGIGTFLMIQMSNNEPLLLDIQISRRGIKIHEDFYSFETISAFWITENKKKESVLILFIEEKANSPLVSIIIDKYSIDPIELRDFLFEFLEEQEMTESLTERIINRIGF